MNLFVKNTKQKMNAISWFPEAMIEKRKRELSQQINSYLFLDISNIVADYILYVTLQECFNILYVKNTLLIETKLLGRSSECLCVYIKNGVHTVKFHKLDNSFEVIQIDESVLYENISSVSHDLVSSNEQTLLIRYKLPIRIPDNVFLRVYIMEGTEYFLQRYYSDNKYVKMLDLEDV